MKVSATRAEGVYAKMSGAPLHKKNDIYRHARMMPIVLEAAKDFGNG